MVVRLLGLGGAATAVAAMAGVVKWEPIAAEDQAARPPASAPDAKAEVLRWKIDLVVRNYQAVQRNFQRVKIYSPAGAEEVGKFEVTQTEDEQVTDLAARVVHADGRIEELPASQFQTMTLARRNHRRQFARRLVAPRLEAGDIVEMQWQSAEDGRFKGSRFLYCQLPIPVRLLQFTLKNSHSGPMNLTTFGATDAKLDIKNSNVGALTIRDLPPYVEEPDMPPAFNCRASVLLVYGELPDYEPWIWSIAIKMLELLDREYAAADKAVQAAAPGLAGGGFREEQLRRLYDFCQTQVTNVEYDSAPASLVERREYREPRTAAKVWKDRRGTPTEINCLFAAMAKAAGFDARLTFSADRSEVLSVRFSHGSFFMKSSGVLVRLEGEWRLFAPGDRAVPFGQRRWQREDTEACYVENDTIYWENQRTLLADQARRERRGQFVIDAEGDLVGEVRDTRVGQLGIAWREEHWNDTAPEIEVAVKADVQADLPEVEVSDIRVEHRADTAEPLEINYRLRLPGILSAAGEQRLLVPAVFHLHAQPRYVQPKRVHPIWWRHPWQELDEFTFSLPPGYTCATVDAPPPVREEHGLVQADVKLAYDPEKNVLNYHREAIMGRPGATTFDASTYPALRRLFQMLYQDQTHAVVLRPADEAKP